MSVNELHSDVSFWARGFSHNGELSWDNGIPYNVTRVTLYTTVCASPRKPVRYFIALSPSWWINIFCNRSKYVKLYILYTFIYGFIYSFISHIWNPYMSHIFSHIWFYVSYMDSIYESYKNPYMESYIKSYIGPYKKSYN